MNFIELVFLFTSCIFLGIDNSEDWPIPILGIKWIGKCRYLQGKPAGKCLQGKDRPMVIFLGRMFE